jgi:hypothetical protein
MSYCGDDCPTPMHCAYNGCTAGIGVPPFERKDTTDMNEAPSLDYFGYLRWTPTSCRRCGYEEVDCACPVGFARPEQKEPPADMTAPSEIINARKDITIQHRAANAILAGFRTRGCYGPDPLRDMAEHAAQILASHGMLNMNVGEDEKVSFANDRHQT